MAFPSPYGPQPGNQFGAGSLSAGTSGLISAAGGLGSMRGVPSGRSSYDPSRIMEQAIRQNRSKGNYGAAFQTALVGNNFLQNQQQEQAGMNALQGYFQKATGMQTPAQPQADVTQAGWGIGSGDTGSREGNVAAAKQAGTFGAIIDRYNQAAKGTGKMMDANGNIVDAPAAGQALPGESFTIPSANEKPFQ